MQLSETAEWVNLALNRWYGYPLLLCIHCLFYSSINFIVCPFIGGWLVMSQCLVLLRIILSHYYKKLYPLGLVRKEGTIVYPFHSSIVSWIYLSIQQSIYPFLFYLSIIDSLELTEFDFANQTPFVKNIQIFDPPTQNTPANEFQSPSTGSTKTVIVANMDIGLVAPDSKLVFKARIGGKRWVIYIYIYI